jgi:hypothetical protein
MVKGEIIISVEKMVKGETITSVNSGTNYIPIHYKRKNKVFSSVFIALLLN